MGISLLNKRELIGGQQCLFHPSNDRAFSKPCPRCEFTMNRRGYFLQAGLHMHNIPLTKKVSLSSNRGEQKEGWTFLPNTSERVNLRNQDGNPRRGDNCSRIAKEGEGRRQFEKKKKYWKGRVSSNYFVCLSFCIWNFLDVNVDTPHLIYARHCAKPFNCIIFFNLHCNAVKFILLIKRSRVSETVYNLPKFTAK